MAMLLLHNNGTVTICHSPHPEPAGGLPPGGHPWSPRWARPISSPADMVKPGAVVIDVGMNRDENGKLCGDVDFAAVEPIAGYITPGARRRGAQ